jgi:hypothetical protein
VITVRYHFSGTRCGMGSGEFGGRTRGGLEESGWESRRCHAQGTGLIYSSGLDEVHVSDDVRFSLRYSDDDHIARELGPLHQAAPCRPGPPRQPGYPGRAPRPGRAGGHPPARPRLAQLAGPCPSWAEAYTGPGHYHGRPARTASSHHECGPRPGESRRAGNLDDCQDQPPDLSLPRRRGITGGDASLAGTEDGLGAPNGRS